MERGDGTAAGSASIDFVARQGPARPLGMSSFGSILGWRSWLRLGGELALSLKRSRVQRRPGGLGPSAEHFGRTEATEYMDKSAEPPAGQGLELVVGLVGPIGTDLTSLFECIQSSLHRFAYLTTKIRVIDLVRDVRGPGFQPDSRSTPMSYEDRIHFGNLLREKLEAHDALALLAARKIAELRATTKSERNCFVIHSLKHPAEVRKLRKIYGDSFVLVASYAPKEWRIERLARQLREGRDHQEGWRRARELAETDSDEGLDWGQRTGEIFHLADFFIDLNCSESSKTKEVDRFIDLLFGHPYKTPRRNEYGMFMAYAAALRSSALGRQVGSCICDSHGEVVALGLNEVPRFGGGTYWDDDENDARDFALGEDSNDREKVILLQDFLKQLKEFGWLKTDKARKSDLELARAAIDEGLYKGTLLRDVIEFVRCVHAEMSSLIDAARRGISVQGCTMYVTTFPCHECTRHIVAAGISKVFYIEPYPKSLSSALHEDSIEVEPNREGNTVRNRVSFEPFVGLSPSLYTTMFQMPDKRKSSDGKILKVEREKISPRRINKDFYQILVLETGEILEFNNLLSDRGFNVNEGTSNE